MKIKYLLCSLLLMVAAQTARADKGMWILNELNQQNIDRMRELGFNMSVDDLYNLDKPSLARAVVIFGGGCTGITVSDQGLIFTNHHCGYSAIQSQSTVNHDYLKDGFVSRTLQDELPIPTSAYSVYMPMPTTILPITAPITVPTSRFPSLRYRSPDIARAIMP